MNKSEVQKLHNRIVSSVTPMAAFEVQGGIRATKITTDLYRKAMKEMPKSLVGIYDDACLIDWLESDLQHIN